MNFISFIFQDWNANENNAKGRVILLLFRTANICSKRKYLYFLGFPYLVFYRLFIEWILSIEIPWNMQAGKNLIIYHGQSLVINNEVVIGENCILRHCTTIGNKQLPDGTMSRSPVIGNNVDIGSNTCIVGDIIIHDNVTIGCGAIVISSIRANCIAVGNPAIEKKKKLSGVYVL